MRLFVVEETADHRFRMQIPHSRNFLQPQYQFLECNNPDKILPADENKYHEWIPRTVNCINLKKGRKIFF